jgi:transcription termination factor Rho
MDKELKKPEEKIETVKKTTVMPKVRAIKKAAPKQVVKKVILKKEIAVNLVTPKAVASSQAVVQKVESSSQPQPTGQEPTAETAPQKNNTHLQQRSQQVSPPRHHSNSGQKRHNNNSQPRHQKNPDPTPPRIYTKEKLQEFSLQELNSHARRFGIIGASLKTHSQLLAIVLESQKNPDKEVVVEGVLERLPDGFGFLRSPHFDYVSSPDDVYISPSQIRRFGLRSGDTVEGVIRKPKENEKYFALCKVNSVNFDDPIKLRERLFFDRLSPMHPKDKFNLEADPTVYSTRIMDLFTPIGKGQRGLIVAPPKVGKTVLMKEVAQSLIANHPDTFLIVLLIDERPEEVADMRRSVKGAHAEVISSTFDESAERHVQVAETVLEKAKRLVEAGKDVVILLDSITRLARAYNTIAPASGKVLTGGIDANALQRPKRFFGAARCAEEGGSLTILASALVETGSRMDEVIFEEFKGTGNMEINMNRKLANRRIYPAFDLLTSGTRREELLHTPEDLNRVWVLQKFLASMNIADSIEFLKDKMKKFKTNDEFFESMNSKKNGN